MLLSCRVKENFPDSCITFREEVNTMNYKTLTLAAVGLTLGAYLIVPSTAFAYRGDPSVKGPNYTVERHDAMEKAFESGDYTAWKNLMVGKGRVTAVVTKENFATFAKAHELAEEGKLEEARTLRASLGLGQMNGAGQGMGMGRNRAK